MTTDANASPHLSREQINHAGHTLFKGVLLAVALSLLVLGLQYILSLVLLGLYALSTFLLIRAFPASANESTVILASLGAFIVTGRLKARVQGGLDRLFYREKRDRQGWLQELGIAVAQALDRSAFARQAADFLDKVFHPTAYAVYLLQGDDLALTHANGGDFPARLALTDPCLGLPDWISVPLAKGDQILGIIGLGPQKSERPYTREDRDFLAAAVPFLVASLSPILTSEAVLAMSRETLAQEARMRLMEQLTANLSHDLKSPLGSCTSIVKRMAFQAQGQDSLPAPAVARDMAKLVKNFSRLHHYISLSLDREMLELGKLVLRSEPVDPAAVCREVLDLHSDYLDRAGIEVCTQFPAEPVGFIGDHMRFEHVVANLVSNALKYARSRIGIDLEAQGQDLWLRVSDDGPGIPDELREHLFTRYASGQDGAGAPFRSTGLGLAICQSYIALMGGTIGFESNSQGTVFTLRLPWAGEAVSPDKPGPDPVAVAR